MDFPLCSPDAVTRRYLVGVLDVVRRQLTTDEGSRRLLKSSAADFNRAVHATSDVALAALHTRRPEQERALVHAIAESIGSPPELAQTISFLDGDGQLARALGDPQRFAPHREAASAFLRGLELLSQACPAAAEMVRNSVLFAIGIRSEPGQIDAFSDPRLPGFIAFAPNNPPAVIAEQILHEGLHTRFWSYSQLNSDVEEYLKDLPAIYSPFAGRGRSALRVIHGVLTYGAVLGFWRRLQAMAQGPGGIDSSVVLRRVCVLENRLQSGLAAVTQVLSITDIEDLAAALGVAPVVALPERVFSSTSDAISVITTSELPDIQKAEALLAAGGAKVSRLVLPLDDLDFLDAFARAGGMYCLNPVAVEPMADSLAGGFSNTAAGAHDIDLAPPGSDAYVYLGRSAEQVRAACSLDADNGAGHLLGIPDCCQAYFGAHWDNVRRGSGDLFAKLIEGSSSLTDGFAECNAAAMYLGKGLCWHFPCSLRCEQTQKSVLERRAVLQTQSPVLVERLTSDLRGILLWSRTEGYCFLPNADAENLIPSTASWLTGKDFYERGQSRIEPSKWVAEEVSDLRRVVVFS